MKTKFKFNVGGFTFNTNQTVVRNAEGMITEVTGVPVEVPAIVVEGEVEYQASEVLEMWNAFKVITAEAPEVLGNFASSLVEEYYKAEAKVMPMHKEHDSESC